MSLRTQQLKYLAFRRSYGILVLCMVLAAVSGIQAIHSQSTGDYRSVISGNWNNPTTWQRYNGTAWVAAVDYPGQNSDVDRVTVRGGNTVTLNIDVNAFMINELFIGDRSGADDILLIPDNGDFDLHTRDLVVEIDGVLEWVKNANIYLPEGSRVINQGGTISTNKSCNASQVIYIGTEKFSTCNGNGGSDYSFDDLETALPPPTSDGDQEECAEQPVQTLTASATPPQNAYVVWYATETGGSEISPTLNTVGTVTYYAESVDDVDADRRSIFRTPVSLTLKPSPTIMVSRAPLCNLLTNTYSLEVTVSSGSVSSTAGTVTDLGGNEWSVSNVPSGTDIVITVTEINGCTDEVAVTSPNCTCPPLNAPVSGGDQSYCSGDPVPELTATVNAGETVDWYDTSSGGVLLASGTQTYTPSGPGTYYAQTRNSVSGCTSSSRTAVSVSEDPRPTATIGPDRTVLVGQVPVFTASATSADTYQWQVSVDGGISYSDLVDGPNYSGSQTLNLTLNTVGINQNNYLYRLLASKSGSSCPPTPSLSAQLTVRIGSIISNRSITPRIRPD
ncbi:hypothetical protein PP178_09905 [Zeaxanthinibacter sp. PT1]|uniref:immunoglobulin domain-containing protein n=1 Tax=Zeaxanthinibacter TaxID=561554 RepID=UPI002349E639|nr:hypothetical protein [Zeaxanthinibacter sp. PT1]MDC6351867.1 hypothetical protein [Zeaxanthinibacter sp. PT1]